SLYLSLCTTSHSFVFFFSCFGHHRALHSFPTRRSSDLTVTARATDNLRGAATSTAVNIAVTNGTATAVTIINPTWNGNGFSFSLDRKSTRLNSSHGSISYAVFCLKKKKKKKQNRNKTYY